MLAGMVSDPTPCRGELIFITERRNDNRAPGTLGTFPRVAKPTLVDHCELSAKGVGGGGVDASHHHQLRDTALRDMARSDKRHHI
jgi:hypothetical protein